LDKERDQKKRSDTEYELYTSLKVNTGVLLTINFLLFWAIPIAVQGIVWKSVLVYPFRPIYTYLDNHPAIRNFAVKNIFKREVYADYFIQQIFVAASALISFSFAMYWQLTRGELPFWLIYAYYFAWVGFGGRIMGGAYTFAHREAHNHFLYQPHIQNSVGNIFENWLGNFFGNVPYNFSTSHISIHHKLQAGQGDTFYQWDLDRSSWTDFMIFLQRVFSYMTGWSSLYFFNQHELWKQYNLLRKGMVVYWILFPGAVFAVVHSPSFLYYVWLQPLFCMSYFIAFINSAYHGFVEFDEKGQHIEVVNSITIIEGDDDYFGEDDHMAHHYATNVHHRDLTKHQESKLADFKKYHGSVFKKLSIMEAALFILLKDWNKLAEHYVDHSNSLSKAEIAKMLEVRAKCKDMTNREYVDWMAKGGNNRTKYGQEA